MGLASFNRMRRIAAQEKSRHPLDHDGDGRKGGSLPKTAKDGSLRMDGPTVAEYVAAGYLASNYPPQGYASRSTADEIAEAVAAQGAPAGLGTDSGDQFSDEQLRQVITETTGKAPHHKLGREKLIEQFNALNDAAAKGAPTAPV